MTIDLSLDDGRLSGWSVKSTDLSMSSNPRYSNGCGQSLAELKREVAPGLQARETVGVGT
jgi:hypothetical protein